MSMQTEARVALLEKRCKELEDAVSELTRIIAAAPKRDTLTLKPTITPKPGARV